MSVPTTGVILIIVGFFFFCFSPKLLYAAMIMSIPFSATAVVNVGWGGMDKGVTAWLFFGTLWIIRDAFSGEPLWRRGGWLASRNARYGLLMFLGAVLLSLCVPMLLNGISSVPDPRFESPGLISLRFGQDNLTQTAYLAFGIVVAIFAAAANCNSAKVFNTLKLYVASSTFAAAWGLFEMWCKVTSHDYPFYIFNTSTTESALGYTETLMLGGDSVARISSVALEPSVLAEELLLGFIILIICSGIRRPLFGRNLDYGALILTTTTLLVSTSTTAYVGIFAALLIAAFSLSRLGKAPKLLFALGGGLVAAAIFIASAIPLVGQVMALMIFNKVSMSSGSERFLSLALAARDFVRFPLFGAGWHNVPCWDLVILILANTGIFGLLTFASFLLPVLWSLLKLTGKKKPVAAVLLSALILTLILAEVSGLTYSVGCVWLVFGLATGAVVAARNEPALQSARHTEIPSGLPASGPTEQNTF
jgi:hypothetical protein